MSRVQNATFGMLFPGSPAIGSCFTESAAIRLIEVLSLFNQLSNLFTSRLSVQFRSFHLFNSTKYKSFTCTAFHI